MIDELVYEQKARIFKALAHPDRVRIVELLAGGEKNVAEIVEAIGAKEANTSRHLAVLRSAGIVGARKEGLKVYYSIKICCLGELISCLNNAVCDIADRHGRIAESLRNIKSKL